MESEGTKWSSSESSVLVPVPDPEPTGQSKSEEEEEENPADINDNEETTSYDSQREIVKALEVLERDSVAIAESFTSLFSSLRLVLSQVTSTSVDHLNCFSDAAGGLQECVLDAATKGNRYINSCLRREAIKKFACDFEVPDLSVIPFCLPPSPEKGDT
ncbi:uncharacterized protein Fot_09074 [Forsythia ovata]|uniref:BLOC-1-related complex subunit 6 C-terminal helix domain-containing protein n=1 Tax=Forsythia ovata TaxID=205694 RepID=A0ABD1WCZ0_9LAMI